MPVPEESTIYCPGCGTGLYEVVKPIHQDTIRRADHLEPLTEDPLERYPFLCPVCSRLLINNSGQFAYSPPELQNKF